ncbi:hypothetical protein POM88_009177 [Heracleum sosnowskyi]|uniref:3-dehydroquinate synthase domain-containing protein n=1 Tax=Heracleum sosnowskyi TaxID=360622 RepID=A0AAD8J9H6_9APIA|nr:hypothetical protein POM88_009177 [Heracleum sosnowskyi]
MSQVDSSVGGKTGVNHQLGKNLIGTFYQPQSVLIDTDTLNTLPERELASGFAEVIRLGLIGDTEFFAWQERNMYALMARDPDALAYVIKRSCENKAEIVSLDEKEDGLRATLNLGHTFGHLPFLVDQPYYNVSHKLKFYNSLSIAGNRNWLWLHGEAVAVGTEVMAVDMSYRLGWIDNSVVERVHKIIKQAKLPTGPPENVTVKMFKSVMALDKKVADGLLRLVLLKGPLALDETFCKS